MKYTKDEAAKELDRVVTDILSNTDSSHWLDLMEEMTSLIRKSNIPSYYSSSVSSNTELRAKLADLDAALNLTFNSDDDTPF